MHGRPRTRRRTATALSILLVWVLLAAPAAADDVPEVTDPRETYIVGFAELSAIDLPPEYRYVASSLPLLIVASLDTGGRSSGSAMTHTYSESERAAYAATLLERDITNAVRSLSSAVRQRDEVLFDVEPSSERMESATEAVSEARQKLAALRLLEPVALPLDSTKPLEFWSGQSTGRLLAPVDIDDDLNPVQESLDRLVEGSNLDILIWGTAEEIRGYLKVDFHVYSPYDDVMALAAAGTVAQPADIAAEAQIIADEVAGVLLGRTWGNVEVRVNRDDAAITVNGELAGFRQATARFLVPGPVTVEVAAQGYRTHVQTIQVAQMETYLVDVILEPVAGRQVRIESSPPEADVYMDSVWVGRTPLDLATPDFPQVVRLRHEGYLESRFVLGPESPEYMARVLLPDTLVWEDEIAGRRDDFYRSMTWLVASIPVTMALNGVYLSVYGAFPPDPTGYDITIDNWQSFGRLGNIFYWASAGSLLVNIGLAVNVAINLFEYLDAGEGAHNQ